jgi:hypothetical protein
MNDTQPDSANENGPVFLDWLGHYANLAGGREDTTIRPGKIPSELRKELGLPDDSYPAEDQSA